MCRTGSGRQVKSPEHSCTHDRSLKITLSTRKYATLTGDLISSQPLHGIHGLLIETLLPSLPPNAPNYAIPSRQTAQSKRVNLAWITPLRCPLLSFGWDS